MSTDVDAGLEDFTTEPPEPSPVQQIEQMILNAERDLERHTTNARQSRELLKRLHATYQTMCASGLD